LKFFCAVPGDNALNHVNDIFSDIGGVIGDSLQISGDR
jgi:hypothetical protein